MKVSNLKVMMSAAGYYIGRSYEEDGLVGPYDRQSDYFATRDEAEKALKSGRFCRG